MDNEQILACETGYYKCFSEAVERENYIRFRDDLLPDMYSHNYTLIKGVGSDDELRGIIEGEIYHRKGMGYCNIASYVEVNSELLQTFAHKPEVTVNGFYLLDVPSSVLCEKAGCGIFKVSNAAMLDDVLRMDTEHDGEDIGVDFCTRRVERRKDTYLSPEGVDCYICYDNGEAVGKCDLFICEGVAKIEDFAVLPSKQRRGYGAAILKAIIETARECGVSTIYLVTDEEDTVKEMYLKCGFRKIGEKTDLFFKL